MFTRIETNFKGRPTSLELGKLNALVGPNRSGKTAILTALRAACTPGPAAAQAQRYFGLAPKDADEVYARLYVDDEIVASFSVVSDNKGKPKAPKQVFGPSFPSITPEQAKNLFPTVTLRDLLAQGDIKAREAIFRRFGELTGGVPEPFALDDESKAIWAQAVAQSSQGSADVANTLAAVGEWLRSEQRKIADEMKNIEKRVKELRDQLRLAPSIEMLGEYRDQIARAQHAEAHAATIARLGELREKQQALAAQEVSLTEGAQTLTALKLKLESSRRAMEDQIAGLQAQLNTLDAEADELRTRISRIDSLLFLSSAADDCLLCAQGRVTPDRRAELATLSKERGAALAALDKQRQTLIESAAGLRAEFRTRQVEVEQEERVFNDTSAAYRRQKEHLTDEIARLESIVGDAADYAGPSSADLLEAVRPLEQAEYAKAQLVELETAFRGRRTRSALVKDLSEKSRELLDELLHQVQSKAESSVNKYMPQGFMAKLDLSDGGCTWCVVTIEGTSDRFLMSGAEKASLMLALSLAWSEDLPVRFIVLDDEELGAFHSSPENLAALLQMVELAVSAGQVTAAFVAGIRKNEVPSSWTLIERS